jgi:putative Ca2+/H+ antiporter (TMEM165/GDT1 family)
MSADIVKVSVAGKLSKKLTIKNIRLINKISGIILVVFGTVLLFGVLFFLKKL